MKKSPDDSGESVRDAPTARMPVVTRIVISLVGELY